MVDKSGAAHEEKDALLPDDHPHIQLFWNVVPVWHDTSLDDLDEEIGAGYACGFSAGFERGIIMSLLKPEWAQGLYHRLRHYYLANHTPAELSDWNDHAAETARAIPVARLSTEDQAVSIGRPRQCDDPPPILATWGEPNQ